ncbi:MAG: nucleotidyl transferase AbiEii/AbiGii toxin family protein [Planctomycetota bacterium]
MRLCEHPDFDQAIQRAAEHFKSRGLRPAIVEKDYYVTEALREVATGAGRHVVFKGGTSLSKGWELIDRFSEDIDLFLDPHTFEPTLVGKRLDRQLKGLRDAVLGFRALQHVPNESKTFGGSGRSDRFAYAQHFGGIGEVKNQVLLESGIASGREPTEVRSLHSYVGRFLAETGATLGADDEKPFAMTLLHFRRTFVEKLYAIHSKVERWRRDGSPLGSYARHYYDLARLATQPEVLAMLESPEFRQIRTDYEAVSRFYFARDFTEPEGGDFTKSAALFPTKELRQALAAEYTDQCRHLCFGTFPSFDEVLARFEALRDRLRG